MINRKYKDTVFRMLFGSEEYKENTLALYNAMNGSHYTDPAELEINTIQDVIYMGIKNDTSFIIGSELNLWEHQSSFNPNMPLRGLSYFARLYENFVQTRDLNVYGMKPIMLPTPKYVVFYNGTERKEDKCELKLSESFSGDDPAVEVTAVMININYGCNRELMRACKTLDDYAYLINEIRMRRQNDLPLDIAVDEAVRFCIEKNILKAFLLKNRAEVTDMFLTEWDEEKYMKAIRREAFEDGREEGRKEEREETILKLMKQLSLPREKVEELLK